MKVAIYIFIGLAIALIIFNSFKLNFDNLLEGDSAVAVISIVAAACVILLMLILKASRKIAGKK
jgi:Mg2+ and Co2+ transporter CorA